MFCTLISCSVILFQEHLYSILVLIGTATRTGKTSECQASCININRKVHPRANVIFTSTEDTGWPSTCFSWHNECERQIWKYSVFSPKSTTSTICGYSLWITHCIASVISFALYSFQKPETSVVPSTQKIRTIWEKLNIKICFSTQN